MSNFYRFPKIKKSMQLPSDEQCNKIQEEVEELTSVVAQDLSCYQQEFEAMDIIQATEEFLRCRGLSDSTLEMLWKLTIEKNKSRGYYEDEDIGISEPQKYIR